jgi:hypothetical protein
VARATITEQYFIGKVHFGTTATETEDLAGVPEEYHQHKKVFSEQASQQLPKHTIWDHAIELTPEAPNILPGRLLPLTQEEIQAASDFVKEHLEQGTII